MASRGDTFAVPLTRLPRLGGPRAGRWTWSSKLTKEVAHELDFQCDLRQVASLLARDVFPPPRGHRLALDSVSLIVDTIRA